MGATSEIEDRTDLARLSAFSDGVFAIAITLLVLSISPPDPAVVASRSLPHAVAREWPDVLSFVISFLVVGNFWIVHHHVFQHVERYDRGLLWLNILFLLLVVFIPYPTLLLGDFEGRFPVVLYATVQTVCWLVLAGLWLYAARDGRLVADSVTPKRVRYEATRMVVPAIVFAASIGIAYVSRTVAIASWFLLFVIYRSLDFVPGIERPE